MDTPVTPAINAARSNERSASADVRRSDAEQNLPLKVVDRSLSTDRELRKTRKLRLPRFLWLLPLAVFLVAAGGFAGLYFQPPGLQKLMQVLKLEPGAGTSTPIAVPVDEKIGQDTAGTALAVIGLGRLIPDGDIVTVAPPFGSADARVAELRVEEGDRVTRGSIVAVLDNEQQFLARLDAARATVLVREASLKQTRISVRASLDEARATLAKAQSAAQNARRDFERAEVLRARGVISEALLDQRRTTSEQSHREVDRARAALSRYQSDDIDSQVDVVVAERNLDAARAELNRARQDVEQAYIRAPLSGTVLRLHLSEGEKPGEDGVMNIGNIDLMTVEVEIYQTRISEVSQGDRVVIEAHALPHPLNGSVSRIGLEVGKQTLIDDDPAANTDARVIEVTVILDNDSSRIASRYSNLQVLARIDAGSGQ